MAMTRSWLAALGIEDAKIDEIVKAHSESITGLKTERDELKEKLKDFPGMQEELTALRAAKESGEDWEKKFTDLKSKFDSYKAEHDKDGDLKGQLETLKSEYESYKKDIETKAETERKEAAYKEILVKTGISEKVIPKVLKVTDFSQIKLDKDGKVVDADKYAETIKADYAEFIVKREERGADTPNPPGNNGAKLTKDDIIAIQDPVERQQKIAENHELFGI